MKIGTWNINGIRKRHSEVVAWVERVEPDVFCLQEIKASAEQVPDALIGFPEYWNLWHGTLKGYSGVSLHVKKSLVATAPMFSHPSFDMEARIVQAEIGRTVFASVYVPNGGKDYAAKIAFLSAMVEYVSVHRQEGRRLVICGDLNVARSEVDVHPKLRKPGQIGTRDEERTLFEALLARGELVDIGRMLAPDDERLFTWWPPWRELRARNIGWRIDYVLASADLVSSATAYSVEREFGTSDHGAVVVELGVHAGLTVDSGVQL